MATDLATVLVPRPKALQTTGTWCHLPSVPTVVCQGDCAPAADRLWAVLAARGLSPRKGTDADPGTICLRLAPTSGTPQGFRLRIDRGGVEIVGNDRAGLFYGVCTLGQWAMAHGTAGPQGGLRLPGVEVVDQPDLRQRGVVLDVSRDKVPTLQTLFALVDRLADWRINQLQLYFEHTFAYRGHEPVWRGASPYTPEDMRALDRHCRDRCVTLVPNQNSFGHFHRWLVHEPYRRLAECPEGIQHPFSDRREPFSLCPIDPGALALLSDLYDQLLPCFGSHQINVGLDETFDLGQGRSAEACAARGKHQVYLDFLGQVHGLLAARGRRMQFWGDIVLEHPESLDRLPTDAIALAWGYEADHPFAEAARQLAEAGLDFYLCPGTSSWNSLVGRPHNALHNLARAACAAHDHGALGLLITDWGDNGHLQPLPVSWPGLLAGACFAWNTTLARDADALPLAELLDRHVFLDTAGQAGRALLDLGDVYRLTGTRNFNGTALFHLLRTGTETLEHQRFDGLTPQHLTRCYDRVGTALGQLPQARMAAEDGDLVHRELTWVGNLLRLAIRLGQARLEAGRQTPLDVVPARARHAFAQALQPMLDAHPTLWSARNRPGGMADSTRWLRGLQQQLAQS